MIMKKTLNLMLVMAALFISASCQKEVTQFDESKADALITFSVNLPDELGTKAISDGFTATDLQYEVYYTDVANGNAQVLIEKNNKTLVNRQTIIDFNLVRGLEYTFIFWAQAPDAPYGTEDLRTINMNYGSTAEGNKENRDAFYEWKTMTISDNDSENVVNLTLKRPFGQLNLLSSDLTSGLSINGETVSSIVVNTTKVFVTGLATVFNTIERLGENTAEVTFAANGNVDDNNDGNTDTFTIGTDTYSWISMNYLLIPAATNNKVNVTASFNLTVTDQNSVTFTVNPSPVVLNNVPISQNYRTNITGDLFTEAGAFNITLDPAYYTPDDNSVTVE